SASAAGGPAARSAAKPIPAIPVPCEAGRVCEPLWPEGAPGALGTSPADVPFLTVYDPDPAKANGAAVVVLPGGAYGILARRREGVEPSLWLAGLGIRAFQLDYRLGPAYHHPVQMEDAQRAMRWVRAHAERFRLDPKRVGVLGFSAGGHLAATLATRFDAGDPRSPDAVERAPDRPDFQILIYPVISMEAPFTHRASRTNLLGRRPDAAVLDFLSAEKHVGPGAPPAFIVHAEADPVVSFANSRAYADALRKAGVPVEFLAFVQGPHAFGLAADGTGEPGLAQLATWPAQCAKWLGALGMLGPPSP
ncbi:MAG TPA: alpha/beta hydrolase, partial [Fibrobacteria bacterium]|nr:alpha/beta hydrolase [Fibrobacteria bacterium]